MWLLPFYDFFFSPETHTRFLGGLGLAILVMGAYLGACSLWFGRYAKETSALFRQTVSIARRLAGNYCLQRLALASSFAVAALALYLVFPLSRHPWLLAAFYALGAVCLYCVVRAIIARPGLEPGFQQPNPDLLPPGAAWERLAPQVSTLRQYESSPRAPGLFPLLYQAMLSRLNNLSRKKEFPFLWQRLFRNIGFASVMGIFLWGLLGNSAGLMDETARLALAEPPPPVHRNPPAPEISPDELLGESRKAVSPPGSKQSRRKESRTRQLESARKAPGKTQGSSKAADRPNQETPQQHAGKSAEKGGGDSGQAESGKQKRERTLESLEKPRENSQPGTAAPAQKVGSERDEPRLAKNSVPPSDTADREQSLNSGPREEQPGSTGRKSQEPSAPSSKPQLAENKKPPEGRKGTSSRQAPMQPKVKDGKGEKKDGTDGERTAQKSPERSGESAPKQAPVPNQKKAERAGQKSVPQSDCPT